MRETKRPHEPQESQIIGRAEFGFWIEKETSENAERLGLIINSINNYLKTIK